MAEVWIITVYYLLLTVHVDMQVCTIQAGLINMQTHYTIGPHTPYKDTLLDNEHLHPQSLWYAKWYVSISLETQKQEMQGFAVSNDTKIIARIQQTFEILWIF